MSYLPPGQAGFFETVQVFFMEVTGRGALFSAQDQSLLERWFAEGRSAQLICRGIQEAVAARGEDEPPPRSLQVCEVFVDREWERNKEQQVGRHQDSGIVQIERVPSPESGPARAVQESAAEVLEEDDLYTQAARAIERAGVAAEDERWREAYRQGWRALKRLNQGEGGFSLEEIQALDEALVDAYFAALYQEEQQALEEELTIVDPMLHQMSPAAQREHLRARRKRVLVRRFGLLDLIAEIFR